MKDLTVAILLLLLASPLWGQLSPPGSLGSVGTYDAPFAPIIFRCTVTLSTATTTEMTGCSVANATASKRYYITAIHMATTTAGTGSSIKLVQGTGTNCGTGQSDLTVTYPNTAVATVVVPVTTPIAASTGNAVCATQSATAGTTNIMITGVLLP